MGIGLLESVVISHWSLGKVNELCKI